ncbi:hypothetical protein ACFPOI_00980 [Nonomuraea angiospora]|uniref:Uncharacterized protein n=1 Tax=Nonomuraea angiospora TaxID=46172 RepID=A0ABR9M388_9ACTN|nr:hypothetical protein [Nonomuraea angiospora]MBE1586978.1 hypothetical protein [Nonomuraea angiospora]
MVPPGKAAAMYRVLAKIPNITVEENATDGDGRKGLGVVLDLGTAGKGSKQWSSRLRPSPCAVDAAAVHLA